MSADASPASPGRKGPERWATLAQREPGTVEHATTGLPDLASRPLARKAQRLSHTPGRTSSAGLRRGRSRLALALLPAALLTTGCGGSRRDLYEGSFGLGFPEPVTDRAERIYELWLGSVAAAAVVGFAVGALILWTAFRYRKTSDQLPRQVRYNLPIEVLYTVVPFVIIAVLFYYTTIVQNQVNELTPEDEGGSEINIGVIGFQWNWTFNYTDDDVSVTGIPGQPPQLVLPTDTTIRFTETSPDVIHSFWVPAFLFKRDVIPGRANTFEITITKEGEYIGRCAELCGEKHAAMNFSVLAVSPEEYESYIGDLQDNPANQIGSGAGSGQPRSAEEIAEQTAGRPS
jgi:cytochrome c oxidase subunit 2